MNNGANGLGALVPDAHFPGNLVDPREQDQLGLGGEGLVPGIIGYQYEVVSFSALAASTGTAQTNFTNPFYTRSLALMLFNPAIDIRVTIRVQHSQREFLPGFSTKIGNVGILYLAVPVDPTDRFIIKVQNQEASIQSPVFTFGFL